jgi:hypothetical protein
MLGIFHLDDLEEKRKKKTIQTRKLIHTHNYREKKNLKNIRKNRINYLSPIKPR